MRPSPILGHLICTLISENEGLEKLRSVSNLRKISGPAELNFFSVHLNFFFQFVTWVFFRFMLLIWKKTQVTNWKKTQVSCTEKKFSSAGPEIFLRFKIDLSFSRPWFSEIKAQNKWLTYCLAFARIELQFGTYCIN